MRIIKLEIIRFMVEYFSAASPIMYITEDCEEH